MSDASPAVSRNFPTELGALGGAIALWAALCAVAATEAGALVGSFIRFGAELLAMPLAFMGLSNLAPAIILSCVGLGTVIGVSYVVAGLWKPHLRPLTIRGIHFIGFIAALMLSLRGMAFQV